MSRETLWGSASRVARKIRDLRNAREARDFYREQPWELEDTVDDYGSLVEMLPNLTPEQLSIMPNTRKFLEKLGDRKLPTSRQMLTDPEWNSHCEAARQNLYEMMWKADQNEYHGGNYPKDETIYFGAKVKSPLAFLIGIVGHMQERMVANTLESKAEPWEKDDLMHAFNELVMLRNVQTRGNDYLLRCFMFPRDGGGLEWISEDYWKSFKQSYESLQSK